MTLIQQDRQISSSLLVPDALNHLGFTQEIQHVETQTSGSIICQWLDRFAGIDYITRDDHNNIGGIASRIRFVSTSHPDPYEEFTVRCDKYFGAISEYDKRIHAIKHGYMFPTFTMQSWYSGSLFLCGAYILTKDLYKFSEEFEYLVSTEHSDREFKAIKWHDLERTGYKIVVK